MEGFMVNIRIVFVIPVAAFIVGCGGGGGSSTLTTNFKTSGITATQSFSSSALFWTPFRSVAGDLGHNTSAPTEMEFFVSGIQLCESLEVNGTAYNNPKNCIKVFGTAGTVKGADLTLSNAADDTSTNWIDLMDADSLKLATTSSTPEGGTYNYATIETAKPMRVSVAATVPNVSGTLKTCSGGATSGPSGLEKITVSNMTSCTQSKIVLRGKGGGVWTKFSGPITLTEGTSYAVDFITNPIGLFIGEKGVATNDEVTYVDSAHTIHVPVIPFVAVIRESSKSTFREQYEISNISGYPGKVVIDLYYAGTAANIGTATIVGAGTRFIPNSSSTIRTTMYNPYVIQANADGTVTLKNTTDNGIVFTRATSATANTSVGTATIDVGILTAGQGSGSLTGNAKFIDLTSL